MTKSFPRAALYVLTTLALTGAADASEKRFFVEDGRAVDVFHSGAEWQTMDGVYKSSGGSKLLTGGRGLDAGDFKVAAELTIRDLDSSAASFVIDYDNHFGFEGNTGVMFVEGPLFGGNTRSLGPTLVKDGEPFVFVFERRNQSLVFTINKRVVYSIKAHDERLGTVSLRPRRSRMEVHEFWADGRTYDEEPQPETVDVFLSGTRGYNTFRIPSIITAPNGDLVAFAEGRKTSSKDTGDIDLVMRRSTNGGRTWGPLTVLVDDGTDTCGNPCPVVDEVTDTIFLTLTKNLGTDSEREIHAGTARGTRSVWVTSSTDSGETWTEPTEITAAVKDPTWRWYATGPGTGIQIRGGDHAGRLVIPCDHSVPAGGEEGGFVGYGSHAFFSDDHGATWQLGEPIRPQVNECQVAELENGDLVMNMRSYAGNNRRRVAMSSDGGATWGDVEDHPELIEPVCQASLLRYTWSPVAGKSRMLFSNPAATSRKRMTVKMSYDDGQTWPVDKLVYRGSAAYSCLVTLPDQSFGVLFEADGYTRIAFAPLTVEWLTDGEDSLGDK